MEAVKTNVLCTENVLEAAIVSGVSKVVCLSTYKAVYPINAMGISKAIMENNEINIKPQYFQNLSLIHISEPTRPY